MTRTRTDGAAHGPTHARNDNKAKWPPTGDAFLLCPAAFVSLFLLLFSFLFAFQDDKIQLDQKSAVIAKSFHLVQILALPHSGKNDRYRVVA